MSRFLRSNVEMDPSRVTFVELFFDLVYVLAVSQLTARLVGDMTWTNAAQVGFLMVVVWWAWIYTTWMASWFHPDALPVRIILLVTLFVSQFMAVSIPHAFEGDELLFAGSYVLLQVLRNTFNVIAIDRPHPLAHTLDRILVWSLATAPLWITGAVIDGTPRYVLWVIALVLELIAPTHGYTVPFLGRSSTTDWSIHAGHFAERFQLFVIVALGESIVVTGATAATVGISVLVGCALALCIIISALLWWLYFHAVASISERRITSADDPGRIARNAYTFGHLPIIAGIIVTAVGAEFVVAHPANDLHLPQALALAGGPALYLIGHDIFRLLMAGSVSWGRMLVAAGLFASLPVLVRVDALAAAGLVASLLMMLAVVQSLNVGRPRVASHVATT